MNMKKNNIPYRKLLPVFLLGFICAYNKQHSKDAQPINANTEMIYDTIYPGLRFIIINNEGAVVYPNGDTTWFSDIAL